MPRPRYATRHAQKLLLDGGLCGTRHFQAMTRGVLLQTCFPLAACRALLFAARGHATAGLSAYACHAAGRDYRSTSAPFGAMPRAVASFFRTINIDIDHA